MTLGFLVVARSITVRTGEVTAKSLDFDDLSFGEIGRLMDDDIRKPVRVTGAHRHYRQTDWETGKSVQFGSRLMRHDGAKSSRGSH